VYACVGTESRTESLLRDIAVVILPAFGLKMTKAVLSAVQGNRSKVLACVGGFKVLDRCRTLFWTMSGTHRSTTGVICLNVEHGVCKIVTMHGCAWSRRPIETDEDSFMFDAFRSHNSVAGWLHSVDILKVGAREDDRINSMGLRPRVSVRTVTQSNTHNIACIVGDSTIVYEGGLSGEQFTFSPTKIELLPLFSFAGDEKLQGVSFGGCGTVVAAVTNQGRIIVWMLGVGVMERETTWDYREILGIEVMKDGLLAVFKNDFANQESCCSAWVDIYLARGQEIKGVTTLQTSTDYVDPDPAEDSIRGTSMYYWDVKHTVVLGHSDGGICFIEIKNVEHPAFCVMNFEPPTSWTEDKKVVGIVWSRYGNLISFVVNSSNCDNNMHVWDYD